MTTREDIRELVTSRRARLTFDRASAVQAACFENEQNRWKP
jgi:hypothetical protein